MKKNSLARWGCLFFCLALFWLFPNPCSAADKAKPGATGDALKSHMEQCTAKCGFDPDKTDGLGERELGKGEEEWRSCVYEGIRKYVAPKSAVPKLYLELIDQDRKLTDLIKKGEMTRSQRKQKNVTLLEDIKKQEEARQAEQLKQKQKDMDEAMRKKMELDMRRGGSPLHAQDSLMRGMGR